MAKTPKTRKITFLDPESEEFSAALTGAFQEGVGEVVHRSADGQIGGLRAVRRVRHAKKKKRTAR
jgi:hypothetical protein